eukprot:9714352-Lingulodinium_polyedra.AAC.1
MAVTVSKLLPKPSAEARQVAQCRTRLQKLRRRAPEKASGRQFYFRYLAKLAMDKNARRPSGKAPVTMHRIMKKHGPLFQSHRPSFKR